MYIFISHSSSDANVAKAVCDLLEEKGHVCFLAPRDIQAGREYAEEIMNGIDQSDICLLLLSERSNQSPHVLREIERAVSKGIPIFVYQLEEVKLTKSMEYFLMAHQWMNGNRKDNPEVICEEIEAYAANEIHAKSVVNSIASDTSSEKEDKKSVIQVKACIYKKRNAKTAVFSVIAGCVVLAIGILFFAGIRKKEDSLLVTGSETLELLETDFDLLLGETYTFGNYNNESIEWQLIHFSDDGESAYLVAKNILCMKAFDGAEGGHSECIIVNEDHTYSYINEMNNEQQVYYGGSNLWAASNLRTWLNSDQENVEYKDGAPTELSMESFSNGYYGEPGFLAEFSEAEKEAILETKVETDNNTSASQEKSITADKVFLLSKEEINWLKEANVSVFTEPTEEAIRQNEDGYYQNVNRDVLGIETSMYWLRDPVEDSVYKTYLVSDGRDENYYASDYMACISSFGVRPVICVDIEQFKSCIVDDDRSSEISKLSLGDSVQLGMYNHEEIEWRVIHFSDDGTSAVLISEDILTMKAFDGAESGMFQYSMEDEDGITQKLEDISSQLQVQCAGNSSWIYSNLRTWLNSTEENVIYFDQAPCAKAMCMYGNGYHTEKGFLANFTKEERDLLLTRRVESENILDSNGLKSYTDDYVFILSTNELDWLFEANVNIYSIPTAAAVEQDLTREYVDNLKINYEADYHYYWLRDAFNGLAYRNMYVSNALNTEMYGETVSAADWIGVRPAITVDVEKLVEHLGQ